MAHIPQTCNRRVFVMKRREFSLSAASAVAASALTLPVATPALAQARQFKEGKDFRRLDKPVALDAWVKAAPKDLSVRRMPVAFNASFVPQQKLYYALEGMGKLEALHAKVFRAIHVEKQKLAKDDEIFAWVAQQGVDATKFKEIYTSFSVSNQVRRASQLQDAYGVEGVPSMGVAGKFYTDGTMAGSMQNVLQVVEHLAAVARKG